MKKTLSLLVMLVLCLAVSAGNDPKVAMNLCKRVMKQQARNFVFIQEKADSDCFTLSSRDQKIIITANNANSMAMGLNYYLQNYCHSSYSWFSNEPMEIPTTLPAVSQPVTVKARLPLRFFLNYCTFGYTMPWWDWAQWEHFIDWMALNGVNLPLAMTGEETVWYNVWRKLGLSDQEVRASFTGPAHLPWHWMSNIDAFQGPLPMSWLKRQEKLQKRIVRRERELNMKPVFPAFAGHIPAAFHQKHPELDATLLLADGRGWGNFRNPKKYVPTFLNSMDPMFDKIQKLYISELTRMYGSDHYYGIDPFNEVDPPTLNPDTIGIISRHIFQSVANADKDAKIIEMAWTFYERKYWNLERQRQVYRSAPQGRMILLDYFCDNRELWRHNESFCGQDFLWSYLGNFGGRYRPVAPTRRIWNRIDDAFRHAGSNFKGVAGTLEGMPPERYAYELTLQKAWDLPLSLQQWRDHVAMSHTGLTDSTTVNVYRDYFDLMDIIQHYYGYSFIESRPSLNKNTKDHLSPRPLKVLQVWRDMARIGSKRDAYRLDLVSMGREALYQMFVKKYLLFRVAYATYDLEGLHKTGQEMKDLLRDYATLMGSHQEFSLNNWLTDARKCGKSEAEKDYYERNARTLITVWNNKHSGLNDYSGRAWDGLILSFYLPRWSMFIDEVIKAREQGNDFDEWAFSKRSYQKEEAFISPSYPLSYPAKRDAVEISRELIQKYLK